MINFLCSRKDLFMRKRKEARRSGRSSSQLWRSDPSQTCRGISAITGFGSQSTSWCRFVWARSSMTLGPVTMQSLLEERAVGSCPVSWHSWQSEASHLSSRRLGFVTFICVTRHKLRFTSVFDEGFLFREQVFSKERLNGHYGVGVYIVSNFISSFPFLVVMSFSSVSITYFMVKYHPGFSHFMYAFIDLLLSISVVESCMMVVAAVVPNFLMGVVVGAGFIVSILLLFHLSNHCFFLPTSHVRGSCVWTDGRLFQGIMMATAGFFRLLPDLPTIFWKYPISYINYMAWALQVRKNLDRTIFVRPPLISLARRSHYPHTNVWDQFTGGLQERHDRDRVRPPGGRTTETKRRRSSNLVAGHISRPLQMVGFGCGCSHSLSIQSAVFLNSQVEGESYPCVPHLLHQENSSPSPEATFVPEDSTVPFQAASRPFLVFSRGPQLSTSLNHKTHFVLLVPLFPFLVWFGLYI